MAESAPSDNLYIQGLPEEFTTDAVTQFFSACGNVAQAKCLGHGCAMVRFSSVEEAATVKENLNGQQPVGCSKPMTITFATAQGRADWNCPSCGDLQFGKNVSCRKCGCPKEGWDGAGAGAGGDAWGAQPAWGKGAKGKGKVVSPPAAWGGAAGGCPPAWGHDPSKPSAPGDWNCTACGDLQFARNTACRKCACPKEGWGAAGGAWGGAGAWGKAAGGKGKGGGLPYGKGSLAMPGGKGWGATGIRGLIDGLIAEGLPGGDHPKDTNALYITNLPHDTTEEDLYTIFSTFGAIPPRGVRVMPTSPGSRTYGFVNYLDNANMEFALMAMNGVSQPDGCKLFVKVKDAKGTGKKAAMMGGLAAPAPNIDAMMMQRLQAKIATGPMTSYDISQWYIIEYLGHIQDEEEMKKICDMLLAACSHLGLQ